MNRSVCRVMVSIACPAVLGMSATLAGAQTVSSYALDSDGKQVARGINSIQSIKEAGGYELRSSWYRPSRPLRRSPRNICREETSLMQDAHRETAKHSSSGAWPS
jgi:hypothetical protein